MRPTILDALAIDRRLAMPLQQQLCRELRRLIHAGALTPGRPLPSSRGLAEDLGLSRNTVTAAYDRLVEEGYLEAHERSGLFVAAGLAPRAAARRPVASAADAEAFTAAVHLRRAPAPFRPCQPDVRLFPSRLWNRLRGRELRQHGSALLMYQSEWALGLPSLRRALATYLRDSRGVRCDWRQVVITSGSQEALFLLAHLLAEPGDRAIVENPGYQGVRLAWAHRGVRLHPLPVDEQGVAPPDGQVEGRVTMVYLTPSRQYPTGACLPVTRRLAWLGYARQHRAWIVEDDYDSEFRYGRAPTPSLHSLDASGCVIYLGSMSKVLAPSLRLGYMVLPPRLLDRFAALRSLVNDHGPLIEQATLAAFIESGAFYAHIRRCRRQYAERLDGFLEQTGRLGLPLTFAHADGGMNLLGRLPSGWDDDALSARIARHGFHVPSVTSHGASTCSPGLVFGFAAYTPAETRQHLSRLARRFARTR